MEPLRFEISGDFITNFAREKYKETNDVSVGVNVLTTALVGFPKDLATSIVLGNKKLVGVNEVYIEDDNAQVEPYGIIQPSQAEDIVCGWIAPDGLLFGHKEYNETNDHHILAQEICKRLDIESVNDEFTLEDLGYLKFTPIKVIPGSKQATQSQKDAVASFCKAHNKKIALRTINAEMYSGSDIDAMDLIMFNKNLCCL